MKKRPSAPASAAALRRRAEAKLKARKQPSRSKVDAPRLLQELQVHQVELEMQNEELRHTRHELAASLERYTELYDFAPAGYFVLDAGGAILQANLTGAQLLGIDRSLLANRRFGLLVAEGDRPAFRSFLDQVFAGQANEACEVSLAAQKGRPAPLVRIKATRTPDGRECRVVVVDITERQQAETALRESERRYRDLFDQANEGLFLMTLEGKLSAVNRAFAAMHGYTVEELKLVDIGKLDVLQERTREVRADVERRVLAGEVVRFEVEHYHKDGHIFPLSVTASLAAIGGQNFFLAFHQDITDRKRAEEAVHQLSARLLQVQDEARRRLARELHDTTAQDLAALVIHLHLLCDRSEPRSARTRKWLGESLKLAEKCAHEVRTQSFLLHPPLLDELGLPGAIRDHLDGFAHRTSLRVNLGLPPDLGRLPRETELALFRVLQEALSNIHRHSGSQTASITLTQTAEEIRLEVRDQGHGMGRPPGGASVPASRGRGDKNITSPESPAPRLGVGISGMRERMHQLGGRLEIQSSAQGTCVLAILPWPQDSSHEPAPK